MNKFLLLITGLCMAVTAAEAQRSTSVTIPRSAIPNWKPNVDYGTASEGMTGPQDNAPAERPGAETITLP